MLEYNENVYKKISNVGASDIVVGVLMIVLGISLGVISIVNGAQMLSTKKHLID